MIVPRRFLESRLSDLLGAEVCIGRLHASPAAGSIEALDMSITFPGQDAPAVHIPRLKSQVSLRGAIHKTLTLTSLAVERPVIRLERLPDGRVPFLSHHPTRPAPPAEAGPRHGWKVDVERVLVVDGDLRLRIAAPASDGYELAFGGVLAESVRVDDRFELTLIMSTASANGRPLGSGGEVRAMGHLRPSSNPSKADVVPDAEFHAKLSVGRSLDATIRYGSMAGGKWDVELRGDARLEDFGPLLPQLPRALFGLRHASGSIHLDAAAAFSREGGWTVCRMDLGAVDVSLPTSTNAHHF